MSLSIPVVLALFACGDASDPTPATVTTPAPAIEAVGRCLYTNPFSQRGECKEYLGDGWTVADAEADCAAPVPGGAPGSFEAELACARGTTIGECVVDEGGATHTVTVFIGDDPSSCGGAEFGCAFSQGVFVPSPVCDEEPAGVPPESAFVPFERVCADPLPGEPAGAGPDGQVCTWEAISGATEAGRRFQDYASCDPIFTQRPYYPYRAAGETDPADPRRTDPAYQAELAWVTSQVESSACVCCHSALAPSGPSGWAIDAEPIWVDAVTDDGLAMLAGWVGSTAFGAFPAADNNGFDRSITGLPTTDIGRMAAFLEGELARRGFSREDFADTEPFGGPLYDQLMYEPGACGDGQGVAADGTVNWTGGPARYVYVLEADSASPGVPPNLDLPDGTVWRLDVDHTAPSVPSGLAYGDAPSGTRVVWPTSGVAPALQPGRPYYLVVLLDVYQPATRCLFVAP